MGKKGYWPKNLYGTVSELLKGRAPFQREEPEFEIQHLDASYPYIKKGDRSWWEHLPSETREWIKLQAHWERNPDER